MESTLRIQQAGRSGEVAGEEGDRKEIYQADYAHSAFTWNLKVPLTHGSTMPEAQRPVM